MAADSRPELGPQRRRRPAPLPRKVGLALLTLAVALLVAEALVRYSAYRAEQLRSAQWLEFLAQRREEKERRPGAHLSLNEIIQPSAHPEIIYQLCPDMEVTFHGVEVTVNEDGFRGPRVPQAKEDGVFRILGLGIPSCSATVSMTGASSFRSCWRP